MDAEAIGWLSGALVVASAIPYIIGTWRKKIEPNLTSWGLWSIIGFTLLLTYKDSGATHNIWPAFFGFTNPTIITAVAMWRKAEWKPMTTLDYCSALGSLLSLATWWMVQGRQELAQFALYLAMAADLFAAIPTIIFVWSTPEKERPIPWAMFAFAYGLGIFAITDHTFANYILPLYMFFGTMSIVVPLVLYRIRERVPVTQWI